MQPNDHQYQARYYRQGRHPASFSVVCRGMVGCFDRASTTVTLESKRNFRQESQLRSPQPTLRTRSRSFLRSLIPTFTASCPWVIAVGGTEKEGPPITAVHFSAGGLGNYFGRPSWQHEATLLILAVRRGLTIDRSGCSMKLKLAAPCRTSAPYRLGSRYSMVAAARSRTAPFQWQHTCGDGYGCSCR